MHFGLNENQVILRDSAREFFAGECPMALVRRAAESATAFDLQLWTKLAAQGYTGIIFDEAHGGVGLGIVELVLLMEEAGRGAPARTAVCDRGDGRAPCSTRVQTKRTSINFSRRLRTAMRGRHSRLSSRRLAGIARRSG
jgi:alkylation response protein AidB-like acyl-CoA dehydrogenase